MKISKWVRGVATGRIKHWNDINNQLVANILRKVETLDEPMCTASKGALIASSQAVDRMFGIEVGLDGWAAIDLLDVQKETLLRIYIVLINFFLALDAIALPSMKDEFRLARAGLFGTSDGGPSTTAVLPTDFNNTKSIETASYIVWEEITKLLNSKKASDPTSKYQFAMFVLMSCKENSQDLQRVCGRS